MSDASLSQVVGIAPGLVGAAAGIEHLRQFSETAARSVQQATQQTAELRTSAQQLTAANMQNAMSYLQESWDCFLQHAQRMAQTGSPSEFAQAHSELMADQMRLLNQHIAALLRAGQDAGQKVADVTKQAADRSSQAGRELMEETKAATADVTLSPYLQKSAADGSGASKSDGAAR